MTHATYVIACYAVAAAVILGLVLWVFLDGRGRRQELKMLEASGIRRRSGSKPS